MRQGPCTQVLPADAPSLPPHTRIPLSAGRLTLAGTHTGSVPSWIASTSLTSVMICIGSVANITKSVLSEGFTLLKGEKITYFSAMFVISRYTFMNRFALSAFL